MITPSFKFLELLPLVIFQAKFFCPEHNLKSVSHINLKENMLVFLSSLQPLILVLLQKAQSAGDLVLDKHFLWYWLFVQASLVQILSESYIFAMHLFICFFVANFVHKIGALPGLAKEPLIPLNVQKIGFLSSINDDFKRGHVTGDHSFKHGYFQI